MSLVIGPSSEAGEARQRVRRLDSHTINQIAAGEVVERPASVVKELVENALDAGARRIEIDLEDYGRRSIRVADDGSGMSEADARTALERHATSKIARVEDLSSAVTLGFRGEALPSIASVSRMTLSSGEVDGLRLVLRLDGGRLVREERAAGPRGTTVTVEDLFFNTPARLRFLKSDATELSAAVDVVSRYALAYPHVSFVLRHGSSSLLSASGSGDPLTAIAEVWGRDLARSLVEIDLALGGLRVRGFVSPPEVTKPTRTYQWLFVNGRPIRSRSLGAAIDQAYRSLTPERRHPIVVLLLDADPARIDANVSPTKSEVKFQSEGQAFDAVRHAIKSGLMAHGMVPSADGVFRANAALGSVREPAAPAYPVYGTLVEGEASEPRPGLPPAGSGAIANLFGHLIGGPASEAASAFSEEAGSSAALGGRLTASDLLDGLRILGQLFETFIVAENRRGLLVIDQHVAHERILYERLRDTRGSVPVEKQGLLAPLTLHLDRRAAGLFLEQIDEVRSLGFDLEPFGGSSFLIRSAPAALRGRDPLEVLRDLAAELAEGYGPGRLTPTRDALLVMCSCKMAVKAGDPLSGAEMEKLVLDLAETENPYFCPHGRPITIVLSREDLLRKFKRT